MRSSYTQLIKLDAAQSHILVKSLGEGKISEVREAAVSSQINRLDGVTVSHGLSDHSSIFIIEVIVTER